MKKGVWLRECTDHSKSARRTVNVLWSVNGSKNKDLLKKQEKQYVSENFKKQKKHIYHLGLEHTRECASGRPSRPVTVLPANSTGTEVLWLVDALRT